MTVHLLYNKHIHIYYMKILVIFFSMEIVEKEIGTP